MDNSHTPTPPSSSNGSGPLNLPPDAPDWVRLTLEKLASEGVLLSEEQMRQLLVGLDEPPKDMDKLLTEELSQLQGNQQAADADPTPLPD